jgi:hypothetical protein
MLVTSSTDLRHDVQRLGVGMQCFSDQAVGDMRSVGVAGVDVGDPEVNSLTQAAIAPS